MKNKIRSLVKINLRLSNMPVKIVAASVIFFVAVYIISNRLAVMSQNLGVDFNIWDGIMKTVNYSSFILGFYFPFIFVITTFFNVKSDYKECIMLRSEKKVAYILSQSITNSILSFLYTSIFFAILFIVNIFIFRFETGWGDFVLSTDNIRKVISILYVNSFVHVLNPIESVLISYIEIFISSLILFDIRDLLMNYIQKKYISYIIMSFYLVASVIFDAFPLEGTIGEVYKYIGLDMMSLLYKHSFLKQDYYAVPITISIIISLTVLAVINLVNLLLNRRLKCSDD